ncbi:MAG: DUF5990 family protein [Actinomycetales bacterium]
MRIHIHGRNVPAVVSPDGQTGTPSVGVQRGRAPAQLHRLDRATGHWAVEGQVFERSDGSIDVRGPWIQGRRGDRFIYLTWGFVTEIGEFTMVRRTKLRLDVLPDDMLREAERAGRPLVAHLDLTAPDGSPVTAAVRPPRVRWSVETCAEPDAGEGSETTVR